MFRTDLNNNPTAFTVDIAKEAGLALGTEYTQGDPFTVNNHTYYTAKLIGDPIALTIRVIDRIGFYTPAGANRWSYMGMPKYIWDSLVSQEKIYVICFMYRREVGADMVYLFPTWMTQKLNFGQITRPN